MQILEIVPEINFWTNVVILNSPVKDKFVELPTIYTDVWNSKNSVIDLLFNETFVSDFQQSSNSSSSASELPFTYMFRLADVSKIKDKALLSQLTIFWNHFKIYVSENDTYSEFFDTSYTTPENIFNLNDEELFYLCLLYEHKIGNLIDISSIKYDEIVSPLSKCIYIYLKCEIDNNFDLYSEENPITDGTNILHSLYEKHMSDHLYQLKAQQYCVNDAIEGVDYLFTLQTLKNRIYLSSEQIQNRKISFPETQPPFIACNVLVIKNGYSLKYGQDFEVIRENDISKIYFKENVDLHIGDRIYYVWAYNNLKDIER